jgi:hypothetical protein
MTIKKVVKNINKKYLLTTTLQMLKDANACEDGYSSVVKGVGKDYPLDKPINLLSILESNCVNHFFWAFRCTTQDNKIPLRLILHDIIKLVEPIYLKQFPNSKVFKQVLKALSTGRGLYAAARAAADAADSAEYAARGASTDVAVNAAANAAVYAMHAMYAAEYAVNAVYAAEYAVNAASYDARGAGSEAAYAAAEAAQDSQNELIVKIIKKHLKTGLK